MVRACFLLLSLTLLAALVVARKDHSLDDLTAVETSVDQTGHRDARSSLGENEAASAHLVAQRVRPRKVVRQSRPVGSIRVVHKAAAATFPITRRQAEIVQETVDTKAKKSGDDDDEDRKTLSQQVADGKYGLIQKEIFDKDLHRPGIISYEVNPEVPKDNINNLGGLRPDDIWLAENHLLVLSGGGFQEKEPSTPVWPPIDNYVAPLRLVKIPPNPKVPPPFPVQLKEGGPVEFIRNENGTGGPPPLPPFFPPPFPPPGGGNVSENVTLYPYPPPDFNPGNFPPGNGPFLLPPPPFPFFPPPGSQNISFFLPPPGFIPGIPPGAAFLPPPGNLTDQIDEDDPSLYYPPPYDFYYPKDNSSIVPPGPLVPGIVLPPPPNFFAPLSNTKDSSKTTTSNHEGPDQQHVTKDKITIPSKKPVKTGPVSILTTTEAPAVTDYNSVSTPTPVYYTTDFPPTPAYTTTTDNSLQDITHPPIQHALPPNAVVQEWVPIPAPRPFYITGPRKPLRKGTTTTTLPPDYNSVSPPSEYINGYLYNTPKTHQRLQEEGWIIPNKTNTYEQELQYFKEITENPKDYYDYYPGSNPLLNQYLTQSLLQRKIKPLSKASGGAISATRGYSQPGREGKGKSLKATYYFYEEPHVVQSQLTDTDDIKYEDASYRSTTPAPPAQYYNPTVRVNPHVNYDSLNTVPNVKGADVSYYYPESYVSVKQPPLSKENPVNYFQYQGDFKPSPIQVPAKVFKSSGGGGQTVYEYSFTAPGYSGQPSKIGTPHKPAVQTNIQSQQPQQYNHYEYQTTPAAQPVYNQPAVYNRPVFTTVSPIKEQYFTPAAPVYDKPGGIPQYQGFTTENQANAYYTTPKPENSVPTQTDNPYHAFFTPQDAGLIDDITKKYFTTVFGQKVNKDSIGGEPVTTPLPPEDVARKAQYSQSALRLIQHSQKLRFPDQQYYTTPATPYRPKQYVYSRPAKPDRPIYSYSYGGNGNRNPISLGSDTDVNYKPPLPPIEPDAEYIDPNTPNIEKPKSPLISYSLPGNGGHFYFLPPQAVRSDNYNRYDSGGGYVYPSPTDTNQGYYKRNAKAPPQRIQQ